MTLTIPDGHVSSLLKLLNRLRPGDYRDMAINRHEELAFTDAVEALRKAIEEERPL